MGPPAPARSVRITSILWAAAFVIFAALLVVVVVAGGVGVVCPPVRLTCSYKSGGADPRVFESSHFVDVATHTHFAVGCRADASTDMILQACPNVTDWVGLALPDAHPADRTAAALALWSNQTRLPWLV